MGRDGFIPWISRPTMKVATWPHGRSWDQSNPPQIRPPNSPQSAHRGRDASNNRDPNLFFDSREFQGYPFPGGFYKSCNDRPAISSREVGIRGGVLLRFHFLIATNGCLVTSWVGKNSRRQLCSRQTHLHLRSCIKKKSIYLKPEK